MGDIEIGEVSLRALEQYKTTRTKTVSPATVNLEIRTIKAFFNCLKKWKILQENPCESIKQLRIPEQPPLYFTKTGLEVLLVSMEGEWLKEIVIFAAMTGLRLGEILNLTWDDVNLALRTMKIRSSHSYQVKAGKMRVVPLNQTVIDLLQNKEPKTGLVFKGMRGGRANGNFVSEKFREAVRAAGLDRRLHFHSLRHTFASLLVSRGVSLYQVQKLLGHSSPSITEVYAHLESTAMHDVVNRLDVGG